MSVYLRYGFPFEERGIIITFRTLVVFLMKLLKTFSISPCLSPRLPFTVALHLKSPFKTGTHVWSSTTCRKTPYPTSLRACGMVINSCPPPHLTENQRCHRDIVPIPLSRPRPLLTAATLSLKTLNPKP